MPTKYDVFAKLIEKGPCKEAELDFPTKVYAQLKELKKTNWITDHNNLYAPLKNTTTMHAFNIIKYCLKNNLDHNVFFSKNMSTILVELNSNQPLLRVKKLRNNKDILETINYLEKHQFILLHNKRPVKGILLRHQLFKDILGLNNSTITINEPDLSIKEVETKVRNIRGKPINPFDSTIFSFLAGSAQLEGATISAGETRDLLVNDIYPDKPQKDIQMVKNLNEALHYILDHQEEDIREEHIKHINYLVMFSMHRNAGKYKTTHNKIQGNPHFKTAPPNKVQEMMNNYCACVNKITSKDCLDMLGYVHNEIQHIHPFADGNSRTTRMIINWIIIQNKLPLLVLKTGCFDEYMNLTKLGTTREDEKLTQLFWNILVHESIDAKQ